MKQIILLFTTFFLLTACYDDPNQIVEKIYAPIVDNYAPDTLKNGVSEFEVMIELYNDCGKFNEFSTQAFLDTVKIKALSKYTYIGGKSCNFDSFYQRVKYKTPNLMPGQYTFMFWAGINNETQRESYTQKIIIVE